MMEIEILETKTGMPFRLNLNGYLIRLTPKALIELQSKLIDSYAKWNNSQKLSERIELLKKTIMVVEDVGDLGIYEKAQKELKELESSHTKTSTEEKK